MLIHQPRWLPAYNSGAHEVPAFGLVEITDAKYDFETPTAPTIVLKVVRPTSGSLQQFAVNSWMPIAVGKTGLVSSDGPLIVSHSSAMSVGDTFGTGTNVFTPDTSEMGMYVVASLGDNRYLCDFSGASSSVFKIGKVVTSAIASLATGTVRQYDQAWVVTSPAVDFTVINPHDIELPVGLKVRWSRYPGWTDWVVEPWHWTECPDE